MIAFLWSIAASLFSKMLAGLFAFKPVTADEKVEHDNLAARQIEAAVAKSGGDNANADLVRRWSRPD